MLSKKGKDMKKRSNTKTSAKKQDVDLKLKNPLLTGLFVAVGFEIGSALIALILIAAPFAYDYVQTLLSQ